MTIKSATTIWKIWYPSIFSMNLKMFLLGKWMDIQFVLEWWMIYLKNWFKSSKHCNFSSLNETFLGYLSNGGCRINGYFFRSQWFQKTLNFTPTDFKQRQLFQGLLRLHKATTNGGIDRTIACANSLFNSPRQGSEKAPQDFSIPRSKRLSMWQNFH